MAVILQVNVHTFDILFFLLSVTKTPWGWKEILHRILNIHQKNFLNSFLNVKFSESFGRRTHEEVQYRAEMSEPSLTQEEGKNNDGKSRENWEERREKQEEKQREKGLG